MKKIVSMVLVLALTFAYSATAYATSYSSTISMEGHSTLAGATRSYVGTSHNISLNLSSKDEAGDNYCKVTLNRVNLTSTVAKKTKELNLKTVGNTYGFSTSNQTDGKYYYYFNSYYTAITTAWTSDSVTMSSN